MESGNACASSYVWERSIPSSQIAWMTGSSVGKFCAKLPAGAATSVLHANSADQRLFMIQLLERDAKGAVTYIFEWIGLRFVADGSNTLCDRMTPRPTLDKMRLDRWLWAARFYKTRSLSAAAIDGGKVQRNGTRVKRASVVHVGDTLRIRKPPFEFTLEVTALSEHRGSATVAQRLYHETPESVAQRELLRTQLRAQPHASFEGKGRPTKKDRRQIDRFKRGR